MLLRIKKHPIIDFKDLEKIPFYFNSKKLYGTKGDSIASALHAAGVKKLTASLKYDRPRGFFCGIGKCSSCIMKVNGIPNVRTCIAPLKNGVRVDKQEKLADWPDIEFKSKSKETVNIDILIIGAGPAGLCAGFEAALQGSNVLLVDENQIIGGQLVKQTHKFFGSKQEKAGTRGIQIAKDFENDLKQFEKNDKIKVMMDSTVIGYYEGDKGKHHKFAVIKREDYENTLYEVNCRAVIFACGAMENMILFPGNDLPGVYGAGAVQTLMNVFGVKPGNKILMVGAGNVGLIVSYQLLQAGIDVDRVIEAMPQIGGYHVHAAKLRRCGVPISTSHSIKEVYGNGKVEGAIVVKLDSNWHPIKGSEEKIDCDTICLAVGLTPSTRLLYQTGAEMAFLPEAGGYVALHDKSMHTSIKGVYVAGDSSGIEEASTAMIEGRIAGLSAAIFLGYKKKNDFLKKKQYDDELDRLRAGPFGEKSRTGKNKISMILEKRNV